MLVYADVSILEQVSLPGESNRELEKLYPFLELAENFEMDTYTLKIMELPIFKVITIP